MIRVAVLFPQGTFASTATTPAEIFYNAGRMWNAMTGSPVSPRFEVVTASPEGGPIRCDRHLSITPQTSFAGVGKPDLVFVPAAGLELDHIIANGYDIDLALARNPGACDWLRRWHDEGALIAAACSGVALVAAAGLLDGKRATTHWGLATHYRARFPQIDWTPEYLVTDAGDIFCGGGLNAAADLALYLVEKLCDREVATQCARAMMIEMPRTWQNTFTHISSRTTHEDEAIHGVEEWLHRHHASEIRFDTLAADLGMSPRNFARRFKAATGQTPLAYLHGLRVTIARRLLENGRLTVKEIAEEVGYSDLLFFRRLFRRHTGVSPNDYRKRFSVRAVAAE